MQIVDDMIKQAEEITRLKDKTAQQAEEIKKLREELDGKNNSRKTVDRFYRSSSSILPFSFPDIPFIFFLHSRNAP